MDIKDMKDFKEIHISYELPLCARSGYLSCFGELGDEEAFKYVNYQIKWEDNFISLSEFFQGPPVVIVNDFFFVVTPT